jgi:hypothetical protein
VATGPLVIWVADTSSIVWPKRFTEKAHYTGIFERLTPLVESGEILYVKQVVAELKAFGGRPDAAYLWASAHQPTACKHHVPYEVVREVLDIAPVLDPHKPSGEDEADPYILALALILRRDGKDARVLTEEQNDLPDKMSMASGCGLLGIPRNRIEPFLRLKGIWTRADGLLP